MDYSIPKRKLTMLLEDPDETIVKIIHKNVTEDTAWDLLEKFYDFIKALGYNIPVAFEEFLDEHHSPK